MDSHLHPQPRAHVGPSRVAASSELTEEEDAFSSYRVDVEREVLVKHSSTVLLSTNLLAVVWSLDAYN